MSIEAMKQALWALSFDGFIPEDAAHRIVHGRAITSLRQAIAEESSATQEPLGYVASMAMNDLRDGIYGEVRVYNEELDETFAIYTHPQPKREWVGLTDEETAACFEAKTISQRLQADAKRIEAKLKEKNAQSPIKWADYENDGRIIKTYPEKDKT